MKIVFKSFVILIGLLIFVGVQSQAQDDWKGKTAGVYISSRSFGYDADFFIEVAQFLKQEEDRSNIGKMKNEFIIRVGDLLTAQLQEMTGADTIYFLNADMTRGRAMLAAYDTARGYLINPDPVLQELDYVLVIDPFYIHSRNHRSVYIRSNRMITENIPVKKARFSVTLIETVRPRIPKLTKVCYDDLSSDKPELVFDFLQEESKMGKYLSQVFSQWWGQWQQGVPAGCGER